MLHIVRKEIDVADEAWVLAQRCEMEAIVAEIEVMKAENLYRTMQGLAPVYGEEAIGSKARALRTLAEYIMRHR
jgi:hypothetical protein